MSHFADSFKLEIQVYHFKQSLGGFLWAHCEIVNFQLLTVSPNMTSVFFLSVYLADSLMRLQV